MRFGQNNGLLDTKIENKKKKGRDIPRPLNKILKNYFPEGGLSSESFGPAFLGAEFFHSQIYPFTLPEKSVVSAHFPDLPLRIRKLKPLVPEG